eukprot:1243586-Pyramimonas_sp.AAC.1
MLAITHPSLLLRRSQRFCRKLDTSCHVSRVKPLLVTQAGMQETSQNLSARFASYSHVEVPRLRTAFVLKLKTLARYCVGTERLQQPSPLVDLTKIHTPEFQDRLETLKKCMIKYVICVIYVIYIAVPCEREASENLVARGLLMYGGIGIAGPQIGWQERVFCFGMTKQSDRYPALNPDTLPFQYWINPRVVEAAGSRQSWFWEGCLSVPGVSGW